MLTTFRPRWGRSVSLGVLAGFLFCAVVFAGVALIASHSSKRTTTSVSPAQASTLVTWENAIHPLVLAASQVVALGPREGVSEVANRTQSMAQLRTEAIGWHVRLTALASQIANVSAPPFMKASHDLLDQAMTGYVNAAHSLLLAVPAHGVRRTSLLAAATADGKAADHLYDEAVSVIAAWRTQLGLAPDWSAS